MRIHAALAIIALLSGCTRQAGNNAGTVKPDPGDEVGRPAMDDAIAPASAARPAAKIERASPCVMQDGVTLRLPPVRGVGTEPFWSVRTEGRCVTYSTPENQAGARVWAKAVMDPQKSVWSGALRGKKFELTIRPTPGCSDGMSDKVYPMEAVVRVDGETRNGCAEPL